MKSSSSQCTATDDDQTRRQTSSSFLNTGSCHHPQGRWMSRLNLCRSGYKIGRFVNIDRFVNHGRSQSEDNTSSLGDDLFKSEIFSQILIGFPQMFVCISLVRKMNFLWLQSFKIHSGLSPAFSFSRFSLLS